MVYLVANTSRERMEAAIDHQASKRGRGRPSKRAEQSERVLDAAERLYSERNPSEVSMRELALASEVPISSLYRSFSGKQDVLVQAIERRSARVALEQREAFGRGLADSEMMRLARAERPYMMMLARAVLEGLRPKDLPSGLPDIRGTMARFDTEHLKVSSGFDRRFVAAVVAATFMGWQLFDEFLVDSLELDDFDPEQINADLTLILTAMMALAEPAGE